VFENVAVSLEIAGAPKRVIRARVAETLERVGLAGRGNERTERALKAGEQHGVS